MILDHVLLVGCGNYSCMIPDWNHAAVGRTAVPFSSNSRRQNPFFDSNISLTSSIARHPKVVSMCKPRPNKINPDFSRKYRGSSSKSKKPSPERENWENLEDNLIPSKNGPLVSLSNSQRYSATATPGRREKEIVELFRKVQSQLRERAAVKEEKRVEAAQHGAGERGTVDSLLKLLRKHSVAQGKKSSSSDDGYSLGSPERIDPFDEPETTDIFEEDEQRHSSFFVSDNLGSSTRPSSSFKRKSPVPKVKFQPVFSAEEEGSALNTNTPKKAPNVSSKLHLLEPEHDDPTVEIGPLDGLDGDDEMSVDDETDPGIMPEASLMEETNLSSMKVSELRELAKSKGIKGYSRLKKVELLELLALNSA